MIDGVISSLNTEKGFGFIQSPSHDSDLFFHYTAVSGQFKSLKIGQEVKFDVDEAADRPRAKTVIPGDNVRSIQRESRGRQSSRGDRNDRRPRRDQRSERPQRVFVDVDFGFITKLPRRKMIGFISSDKGGFEFRFEPSDVTGEKRFSELEVGDYVRFERHDNPEDEREPLAKNVAVIDRHVSTKGLRPPRHPNAQGKKPTWR